MVRVLLLIGLSIATSLAAESPAEDEEEDRTCFWARDVSGWKAGGRDSFALSLRGNRHVQFEVKGICPDLRYARGLSFRSNSTRVCGQTGDSIRVDRQRCFLENMRWITEEQYRALHRN